MSQEGVSMNNNALFNSDPFIEKSLWRGFRIDTQGTRPTSGRVAPANFRESLDV